MVALVSVDEVKARLEFELSDKQVQIATKALEDLSAEAAHYGSASTGGVSTWTSESTTPPFVRTLILKAAVRYMKNPDGYVLSRAGDESVQWSDRKNVMGDASFTEDEKKLLKDMGGRGGLHVMTTYVWSGRSRSSDVLYVPTRPGGAVFPLSGR